MIPDQDRGFTFIKDRKIQYQMSLQIRLSFDNNFGFEIAICCTFTLIVFLQLMGRGVSFIELDCTVYNSSTSHTLKTVCKCI